jgi:hypothetical protein
MALTFICHAGACASMFKALQLVRMGFVCVMTRGRFCFLSDPGLLDELQAVVFRYVCVILFSVTFFV